MPPGTQLPIHTQSLANIAGNFWNGNATGYTLTYSSLTPGISYEVYVFGMDTVSGSASYTITGQGNPATFTQTYGANQLWVNGAIGNSSQQLTSYAIIVVASPSGTITIESQDITGDLGLAGLAIRAAPGEIRGAKWNDVDGDGVRDAGEPGLANWEIYVDSNTNGLWDSGEPKTTTDASGNYSINGVYAGTHSIAEIQQSGWQQVFPGSAPGPGPGPTLISAGKDRLFAVPNDGSNQIVELNPNTGAEINRFGAPESFDNGPAVHPVGLAYDGQTLYFLNGFGSDTLYELNPNDGSVIESTGLDPGDYDGLAALNGFVYVSAFALNRILRFDPVNNFVDTTLNVPANIDGGLAAIRGPDRLVATVAFGASVALLDPATGAVSSSFTPTGPGVNNYGGVAVIGGQLYLGRLTNPSIDIYSRTGQFRGTRTLPYSTSGLAGDDSSGTSANPGSSVWTVVFGADGMAANINFGNQAGPAGETTVAIAGGNLVITDIAGGNTNDTLTISRSGANVRVHDPNNQLIAGAGGTQVNPNTVDVALASFGGSIQVNTLGGSDVLTVDFSGGSPLPSSGMVYSGGTGASDTLVLTGGTTTSVTHMFTNANDGSVTLSGALAGTISYTGLEPITDNLNAADRIFTFNGGIETITVSDHATAGMTSIDSTLGEIVHFTNPTATLTINAGTANDTVTITSVDAAFRAALTIDGGANTDIINLNAALLLGSTTSSGNLSVIGETINLFANISTDGDTTNNDAGSVSLTGAMVLRADITIDSNAATADGNVTFGGLLTADNSVANDRKLIVDAGTATVHFQANVGTGTDVNLADLDVTGGLIRLGGSMIVEDQGGNTVTFNGPVELAASPLIIDAATPTTGNSIVFNGTINADNAATQNRNLLVFTNTGTLQVLGAIGNLQPLSGLVLSAANGLIRLGANVTVTDGTAVDFVDFFGPLQLDANVTINSNGATVDHTVLFRQTVNADNAATQDRTLTIDAGGGTVAFFGNVGNTQPLADLDVTAGIFGPAANMSFAVHDGPAATVTINGNFLVGQTINSVLVNLNGVNDHGLTITGSMNVENAATQNAAVTIDAGTATVQLGPSGLRSRWPIWTSRPA